MKTVDSIQQIAVAGAGTMGSGIAQLTAQAGFQTILFDLSDEAVKNGFETISRNLAGAVEKKKISNEEREKTLSRIKLTTQVSGLVADVIIEAIIEKLEAKVELFKQLAEINSRETIFCTNTSSIPVSNIADHLPYPEQLVGMHFFNPPHLMKLVEVVSGKKTSPANAETIFLLAKKLGKEPVNATDSPGFIVNRIGKLYHTEPLKILEEKIAPIETIDALLESSGFRMGPFKLIDLIGVDANLNVTKSLYELFDHHPKFQPSETQQELVDKGFLGKKSGSGFYKY